MELVVRKRRRDEREGRHDQKVEWLKSVGAAIAVDGSGAASGVDLSIREREGALDLKLRQLAYVKASQLNHCNY